MCHVSVRAVAGALALLLGSTASAQVAIAPYCSYLPDWVVFRAGDEVVQHSLSHSGADSPGTMDAYEILLPRVDRATTLYDTVGRRIRLKKGDEVLFDACGCVQTGGRGDTWKRYVNPTGDNSDRLYHGGVLLEDALALGLQQSRQNHGMVRFSDLLAWQRTGKRLHISVDSTLVLGYEDDNYTDNGYANHDDGNDGQCKGIGSAAVSIVITHH